MKTRLFSAALFAVLAYAPCFGQDVVTLNDLKKLVENTTWVTGDKKFLNFYRGGKLVQNVRPSFGDYWAVEKPDVLKLWNANPAKNRKAPYTLFRINVATKTAKIDVASSTASGPEGLVLTYEGPAKPPK